MYRNILSMIGCQLALCLTLAAQSPDQHFQQITKAFRDPNSKTIMIAAHRGAHLEDPENSLTAFRKAIQLGIDFIELDVRCTKDGVLVLMHDRTVDRTTNGTGPVDQFTFEEIRKLRLKHNGKVTEEIVPTLEEALTLAKGKIMVDLDIKVATCVQTIMETVQRTKTENQCLFFVAQIEHVQFVKNNNPAFMVLMRTGSAGQVDGVFAAVKPEAIHIDPSHNTSATTGTIKSNGARAWINALGDVDREVVGGNVGALEKLLSNGANIIQTDQPALLKAYLVSKNLYY